MPGAYGKSVPLQLRTTGALWFGIAWCSLMGILLLGMTLPLLVPWHPTGPACLLVAVLMAFEWCFVVRGIVDLRSELNRRKKSRAENPGVTRL
ncbi:MAG: hypothetical protein JWQ44_1055 [Chthoniobacter sp.]|jgi:uncharacterized membrane protein|nr:hypothetical protein [Chthoniobacter sp.]